MEVKGIYKSITHFSNLFKLKRDLASLFSLVSRHFALWPQGFAKTLPASRSRGIKHLSKQETERGQHFKRDFRRYTGPRLEQEGVYDRKRKRKGGKEEIS